MKRLFDVTFSSIGLIFLAPLFIAVALLIKLNSKGPVFFRQERIGKNFRSFRIYKFRTMVNDAEKTGPQITLSGDQRITKIGDYLRKLKIDEMPQLINVLKGDMSFVGSRPEVKKYVEMFQTDYEKLLKIRPGITDPASIKYSKEEDILSSSENWEEEYIKKILPNKIKFSLQYVDNHNMITDLKIIMQTIFRI
jgi:lipopolysaccharide/colanic/teichoic acid biosynthesis glycosyltransferase